MAEHTKGPLRVGETVRETGHVKIYDERGFFTAIGNGEFTPEVFKEKAETLVARWNALEGYDYLAIKAVAQGLRYMLRVYEYEFGEGADTLLPAPSGSEVFSVSSAKDALARLEGGAS